jgi:hypothetical protein
VPIVPAAFEAPVSRLVESEGDPAPGEDRGADQRRAAVVDLGVVVAQSAAGPGREMFGEPSMDVAILGDADVVGRMVQGWFDVDHVAAGVAG